jgi:hypothetical protein
MGMVLLAARRGADVDLLAACARYFRSPGSSEYAEFVCALMGDPLPVSFPSAAGSAVLAFSRRDRRPDELAFLEESLSDFQTAWRTLAFHLLAAPVEVVPFLAWEYTEPVRAHLWFSPIWCERYVADHQILKETFSQDSNVQTRASEWTRSTESVVNPWRALSSLKGNLQNARQALSRLCGLACSEEDTAILIDLLSAAVGSATQGQRAKNKGFSLRDHLQTTQKRLFDSKCCQPDKPCIACRINLQDLKAAGKALHALLPPRQRESGLDVSILLANPKQAAKGGRLAQQDTREPETIRKSKYRLHASQAEVAKVLGVSRAAITQLVGRARQHTKLSADKNTRQKLRLQCPACQCVVAETDEYCPECGSML